MIVIKALNIQRSDKLPSDRWRVFLVNSDNGTVKAMCDCVAAHASEYDANCCPTVMERSKGYIL